MAAGRVRRSRLRQSSGLHAAGITTVLPPMSRVVALPVSLSERRTCSDAYGPPMAWRMAAAAAFTAGLKKRPERSRMFIGRGHGGAPTSRLSSPATVL